MALFPRVERPDTRRTFLGAGPPSRAAADDAPPTILDKMRRDRPRGTQVTGHFDVHVEKQIRVAARLVVGPDDVLDVGVGNERYDAVAPSGYGVGSEVDGGHYKSSSGPRFRLRASVPGPPQRAPMRAF